MKKYFKRLLKWARIRRNIYLGGVKYRILRGDCKIVPLTKEQKNEIQSYYKKHFGRKIDTKWHELYTSVNGRFNVRYFPLDIYLAYIVPAIEKQDVFRAYDDKNIYSKLLPSIKQPYRYLRRINGYFYTDDYTSITRYEAEQLCQNIEDAIIKPSFQSCGGKNVHILKVSDGLTNIDGMTITEIIDRYGKNFVIEERIRSNVELSKLNELTLSTIRTATYRSEDGAIHVTAAMLRMGHPGAASDNMTSGGTACRIKSDGTFYMPAVRFKPSIQTTYESETRMDLTTFVVPMFEQIKKTAIEAHKQVPQIRHAGWDLTVNDKNEIVLLEFNTPQGIYGLDLCGPPIFEDCADEMLELAARYRKVGNE